MSMEMDWVEPVHEIITTTNAPEWYVNLLAKAVLEISAAAPCSAKVVSMSTYYIVTVN